MPGPTGEVEDAQDLRGAAVAEQLRRALPHTHVVKTLNTMVMTAPATLTQPPSVFLSGDDPEAEQVVTELLTHLGWDERWTTDLGGIETARATEAAILFVPHIIRSRRFRAFAVSVAR
ncbi:hypothetical protein BJY24_004943 [Nocardia transvalensis]|uniref:Uncharacterized protein n=1 Tax=Nocardia transvalensis TaxID=37333 RepID=A0A7W9PH04_9NOCA|nr:hypothetical protein [Nocardia transvalensis]MBB5916031.1 hypothetical protein [Nocardia transvalensis]